MNFIILSYLEALDYQPNVSYAVMLRIAGSHQTLLPLFHLKAYREVLEVYFDDFTEMDFRTDPELERDYRLISDSDAELIARFYIRHIDCDLLVTHCFAGLSRSPASAKAWCYLKGDKEGMSWIDSNYYPNPLVYKKLKEAIDFYS